MGDVFAWRTVPLTHLTWFQRMLERVRGGSYMWCPEVTHRLEFVPGIYRVGRP